MSVLVYADSHEGKIKKAASEAVSYGAAIARPSGDPVLALVLGTVATDELAELGRSGATRVINDPNPLLVHFDSGVTAKIIVELARHEKAGVIVFSHNFHGKAVAPLVAASLSAGLVTGVIALPDTTEGFVVRKGVFSGKAFARVRIKSETKVLTLSPNAFPIDRSGQPAPVETLNSTIQESDFKIKVLSEQTDKGEIPLPEAEIIVSGGRGMKGPENWGILEDLARALGAALACSRPVADSGWRPHHEHVGQTGLTVRPNLYIAVGISGAIQHLAGVNGSKVIVVINRDPEAPFFQAADYGIVGDAFIVVPAITEAVKKLKA